MNVSPNLTLVLGGASSGKSDIAEKIARQRGDGRELVYLATAEVRDDAMREAVERHRRRRGDGWTLIEEPLDAAGAIRRIGAQQAVLVECLTMWLSNHLLLDDPGRFADARRDLLEALAACPAPVVAVSNEVGLGVVPDNDLAVRFRQDQGRLNREIAQAAHLVVNVVAGLPQCLKGSLP